MYAQERGNAVSYLSRAVFVVAAVAIVSVAIAGTATADPRSGLAGDGNESDPFVITSAEELQRIDEIETLREEELDVEEFHYVLGNDIEANETDEWEGGAGFDPIGDRRSVGLTGSFDGRGHAISGLHIARPADSHVGLFTYSEGTIENVTLENVTVVGDDEVGAVVGRNADGGTVDRVSVTGDVRGTSRRIGGIVGRNYGEVSAASVVGKVESTDREIGGVIGNNHGAVDKSYFVGTVSGDREIGGVVGDNQGTVRAVFSSGESDGEREVGGIVGKNDGAVSEVYAITDVEGQRNVAGLAGTNSGTIATSYALGSVSDGRRAAGAVASNDGIVESVYWDVDRTGRETGIGDADGKREDVIGLEPWEFTGENATEYTALDFDSPWTVTDGYPRLEWEDDRDVPDEVYDLEVQTEPPETPSEAELNAENESDDDGLLPVSPVLLSAAVVLLAAIIGGGFYGYRRLEIGAGDDEDGDADARDGQPRRRRRRRS